MRGLQNSSSRRSPFCCLPLDLCKSLIKRHASFPLGIVVQSGLKPQVGPTFLGVMRQLLVSLDGENHSRRFAVMGENTRSAMLFQFNRVFARPAGKVGETDDVLIENQIHSCIVAQNNVR